jgi:nitrite reductase/ring-hydroxylating ferredoxin subunit
MTFVEVAKVSEIPVGKMKRVEAAGVGVLVANVDGKFYAVADRCGHMNALLSMGTINGSTVACPWHGSKFNVTTGKKLSEPTMTPPPGVERMPEGFQKYLQNIMRLVEPIKCYDLQTYDLRIDQDKLSVNVP